MTSSAFINPKLRFTALAAQLILVALLASWAQRAAAGLGSQTGGQGGSATPPNPALAAVERGVAEMRSDPEASKRDADEALRLLQARPDPDLEIRARLILCDYQAERDTGAAAKEIDAGTALLTTAHR